MSSDPVAAPVPMMVNAATGQAGAALSAENLAALLPDLPGADQRSRNATHLGTDSDVASADDLTQAGWCVIFASDADPAIKARLQPLIDMRGNQVGDDHLFQVFDAANGVQPGQAAQNWVQYRGQSGVSLTASVDPTAGLPYYVLIVGSPDRIPFEFQNLLKMQWAVGRLAFDDVEDYGRYAQAIVQYENAKFKPVQRRNAAVWITRNQGDPATGMLSGALCPSLVEGSKPLGSGAAKFSLKAFTADGQKQATKQQLLDIVNGEIEGGPPAVLFTGSHGAEYPMSDPAVQRKMQGALITQEWTPGTSPNENCLFSAADLPAGAKLQGMMGFHFACFGGGCPAYNNYYFKPDGSRIPVAPTAMVSALPQALLRQGMLAVIAHTDMAFPYAFQDVNGIPQVQGLRDPLNYLMYGWRVGHAADCLSVRWSSLCAQLAEMAGNTDSNGSATSPTLSASAKLALTLARDDARNYMILGDPAARLRVKDLQ